MGRQHVWYLETVWRGQGLLRHLQAVCTCLKACMTSSARCRWSQHLWRVATSALLERHRGPGRCRIPEIWRRGSVYQFWVLLFISKCPAADQRSRMCFDSHQKMDYCMYHQQPAPWNHISYSAKVHHSSSRGCIALVWAWCPLAVPHLLDWKQRTKTSSTEEHSACSYSCHRRTWISIHQVSKYAPNVAQTNLPYLCAST